jgi:uncharacterized protein
MIKVTESIVDRIADLIAREVKPVRVILFGSHARGDAENDSDIDLLVVEEQPFSDTHSRWTEIIRIRHALSSIRHPKDILVYSVAEMEKWQHSLNHIVSRCLREGKVIYERH